MVFFLVCTNDRFRNAECIQIALVLAFIQQLLSVILTVDIQKQTAEFPQLRRRHRYAADAASCLALCVNLTAKDQLVLNFNLVLLAPGARRLGIKRSAYDRFFSAGTNNLAGNAPAEDGLKRIHNHGFTGTGFTR